jgi:hypothetical protein
MTLNAVSNPAYIALQAYMGNAASLAQGAINYSTGITTPSITAAVVAISQQNIPVSTLPGSPVSVSLLSLFPNLTAPVFLCVFDVTTPGQVFYCGTASGTSAMVEVSANGFWAVSTGGILPPIIYLANPSSTIISDVNIAVMSN